MINMPRPPKKIPRAAGPKGVHGAKAPGKVQFRRTAAQHGAELKKLETKLASETDPAVRAELRRRIANVKGILASLQGRAQGRTHARPGD